MLCFEDLWLVNSMWQNPAAGSDYQSEITCFLRNLKALYLCLLLDLIPSQTNLAQSLKSICLMSHLYLDLSIDLFISHFLTHPPCACYMLHPFQRTWSAHSNGIWWKVKAIKIFIMYFLQSPAASSSVNSIYSSRHPVPRHPQIMLFFYNKRLKR